MALSTHVTDRFGTNSAFLRGLTNHDDEDASTVNATRLGLACDDAEGDFPVYAGQAYDDTNAAHIRAGVQGAIAYLRAYSSKQGAAEGEIDAFRESLKAIARIGPRKRVDPQSKSVYTPSTPDTTAGDVRPRFDPEQFEGIRPNAPEGEPGTT